MQFVFEQQEATEVLNQVMDDPGEGNIAQARIEKKLLEPGRKKEFWLLLHC